MTTPRIEKDHIAPYRHEFAQRPTQCWKRLPSCEYRQHRRARRRAAKEELRNILQREGEMISQKPFDALAHAIDVLGQPDETGMINAALSHTHGIVGVNSDWNEDSESTWLRVVEWSEWPDGDQSVTVCLGGFPDTAVQLKDDGSLCPEFEAQARAHIDAYALRVKEGAR